MMKKINRKIIDIVIDIVSWLVVWASFMFVMLRFLKLI